MLTDHIELGLCRWPFCPLSVFSGLNRCHLMQFRHCIFILLSSSSHSHFLCFNVVIRISLHSPIHVQHSSLMSTSLPVGPISRLPLSLSSVLDHLHAPPLALLGYFSSPTPSPSDLFPSFQNPTCLTQFSTLFLHFLPSSSELFKLHQQTPPHSSAVFPD